jgi:hypothetical protein
MLIRDFTLAQPALPIGLRVKHAVASERRMQSY